MARDTFWENGSAPTAMAVIHIGVAGATGILMRLFDSDAALDVFGFWVGLLFVSLNIMACLAWVLIASEGDE